MSDVCALLCGYTSAFFSFCLHACDCLFLFFYIYIYLYAIYGEEGKFMLFMKYTGVSGVHGVDLSIVSLWAVTFQ